MKIRKIEPIVKNNDDEKNNNKKSPLKKKNATKCQHVLCYLTVHTIFPITTDTHNNNNN